MSMSVEDLIGAPSDRSPEDLTGPPESDRPTCQEPGCSEPCRKRRGSNEFFPYCAPHNAQHSGSGAPKSRKPEMLSAARKAQAERTEKNVVGWLSTAQVFLVMSGDNYCAWALGQEGPHIAKTLGDVSQDFNWLGNALDKADKWGSLTLLAFHSAKLAAMIAVHHGLLPYDGPIKLIVPPPPTNTVPTPEPYVAPRVVPEPEFAMGDAAS